MFFSRTSTRSPPDPEKFPLTQLLILGCLRISEPIALTSIFPYAWKLVVSFDFCSRNDASFYAGVLISAFALSEAVTGMYVTIVKYPDSKTDWSGFGELYRIV